MSEISNNQHYACYYPYTGRITGQTTNLKYWIQVPDETLVGPRPDDGWPLVIQCPGSGYYHPDQQTAILESDPDNQNGNYHLYPAVRILPRVDLGYTEWICLPSGHVADLSVLGEMRYEQFHALRNVIDALLNQTAIFYKVPTTLRDGVYTWRLKGAANATPSPSDDLLGGGNLPWGKTGGEGGLTQGIGPLPMPLE